MGSGRMGGHATGGLAGHALLMEGIQLVYGDRERPGFLQRQLRSLLRS